MLFAFLLPGPLEWVILGVLAAVGAYDRLEPDFSFVNSWIWNPAFPRFRRSADFQRFIREMNLPAYWEVHGLPESCRHEGERYLCETPADRMRETP